MLRAYLILTTGILLLALVTLRAQAQVSTGISIGKEGVQGFYFAIGEYYHLPEKEVIVVHERRVPDEELPVVFFIAREAHVALSVIIDLRLSGKSWWEITVHYGLSPEIFYVPVEVVPGPPYGKAYGYYKKKPRKEWKSIVLSDVDVVNFVNLRFMTEHYGYRPEEVIRMRSAGKSFVVIHDEVIKGKAGKGEKHGAGKGKGKGKGRKK